MQGGTTVSLADVLNAREARAARQRALLAQYRRPVLCFTLNIAGSVKTGPWIQRAFDEGLHLLRERFAPIHVDVRRPATGYEALLVVEGDPIALKRGALAVEQADALGRLFDVDVLDTNGDRVSREAIGASPRTCLICDGDAHVCARARKHGLDAIIQRTNAIIDDHFACVCADHSARLATEALLTEACVSPKPGLVDRFDSGAHEDMDIFTFMRSAAALTPYFRDCALVGWNHSAQPPESLMDRLREHGLRAESAMQAATGGVNTHKGAIYSLGILCAAMGRLRKQEQLLTSGALAACGAAIARSSVERALCAITPENAATVGERLYATRGLRGVRGEVANGFLTVLNVGLPILRAALTRGLPLNDAAAIALVHLIASAEDTVLIARARDQYDSIINSLQALLNANPFPAMPAIAELNHLFTRRHLSPGGSADLLAVTLMLHAIESHPT